MSLRPMAMARRRRNSARRWPRTARACSDREQRDANNIVAEAVARGVNYFDVAPSYGNGEAKEKLGPALAPHRKSGFLACQCERRDAEGARQQLETSLKRLETDHFDLYQFHAVASRNDVDQIV